MAASSVAAAKWDHEAWVQWMESAPCDEWPAEEEDWSEDPDLGEADWSTGVAAYGLDAIYGKGGKGTSTHRAFRGLHWPND